MIEIDIRQGIWDSWGMNPTTLLKPKSKITHHSHQLPKSLDEAAGLLKKKYSDLKKHYRTIRREWPHHQMSSS